MQRLTVLLLLLVPGSLLAQGFDSALAPYPSIQERFDPAVEAILSDVSKNAPADGAFSATVSWAVESAVKLDLDRQKFGLLSLKSCPNWHFPKDPGYWEDGEYAIAGRGRNWRIDKPEDSLSPADWWQKDGEHAYSRAWSVDWPVIWRFHHDAFEAGMLGYCEGLGLLLWAFQPEEYLRRADHLEVGEPQQVGPVVYKTLVATPSWIHTPLSLKNRTHYPFNESTLMSWASLRPVVTYYIDPATGMIAGADFVYHRVLRSGPKDWKAASKPSGLSVRCFFEGAGQAAGGAWYPTRIVGEVFQGETMVRRTSMAVQLGQAPVTVQMAALPGGKRKVDPWPKYQTSVYEAWLAAGDVDHANRFGLAAALAYEGTDVPAAFQAIADAIAALEGDKTLLPETFGGIDWEMGFALYELFWRQSDSEFVMFWDAVPRSDTWLDIVNRAAELHGNYRGKDHQRVALVRDGQALLYAQVREQSYKARCQSAYMADLQCRAAEATDPEEKAHLQSLVGEVSSQLAR